MKFTQMCAAAALLGAVSRAEAGLSTVFEIFKSDLFNDSSFYKGLLLNMQRDVGNDSSACMQGYEDFYGLWLDLEAGFKDDAEYLQGLAKKGQGAGTNVGFYMDKGSKYIDLAASFVNTYNQCDVDYYMIAVSRAVSNVSGFCNQVMNIVFRYSEDSSIYA